jgi:hypothetical protein
VASAAGFAVGDRVIIATGGEAGAGARGTKGVGGVWPAVSYANTTAMNADIGQANGRYAWEEAGGNVYRFTGGAWVQVTDTYYTDKAIPKALVAAILSINGHTLTLEKTASASATNAAVYRDNLAAFNALAAASSVVQVPADTYAISDAWRIQASSGGSLIGAGEDDTTIFIPDGVFHTGMVWVTGSSDNFTVRDIHLRSNEKETGFGLQYVSEFELPQGGVYPTGGVFFLGVSGGEARNVKVTDVFQKAVGAASCTDTWAYDCKSYSTTPLHTYVQWLFQWSDCIGGGVVDCLVDSDWLTAGFEGFKTQGDFQVTRAVGRNAVMSMNSCGDWTIDSPELTIEEGSQHQSPVAFVAYGPLININTNIGPNDYSDNGGDIINPVMVVEGYINSDNDMPIGIIVNVDNPNVVITGGSYTGPNYAAPSLLAGPLAVSSDAANLDLSNFTVIGTPKSGRANIEIDHGTVTNCVAEVIDVNP